MTEKTGIFVGIPKTREYKPFQDSLSDFLDEISKDYYVEVVEEQNRMRDDARNILIDDFLASDKDYLLFLDDDHSGHKPEMLETLINSNALFSSLKCYSRYFPFQITTVSHDLRYFDNHSLCVRNTMKGYSSCKFAGFGMALIKRELFDKIEKPYFECDKLGEREDNYFCDKLAEKDIFPIGCFDYTLDHNGINEDNILEVRQKGIKDFAFKQHQKDTLKRIQKYNIDNNVTLSHIQEGKLQVMDILLNNEINIINNEVVMVSPTGG